VLAAVLPDGQQSCVVLKLSPGRVCFYVLSYSHQAPVFRQRLSANNGGSVLLLLLWYLLEKSDWQDGQDPIGRHAILGRATISLASNDARNAGPWYA
jgi:hypothetical protein